MTDAWLLLALACFTVGALAWILSRVLEQLSAERRLVAELVAAVQSPGHIPSLEGEDSPSSKLFISEDDELREHQREALAAGVASMLEQRVGAEDWDAR